MKIELPKKVLFIINNLQLAGYDAFAVGGCVRDSILARKPQDWDITTSAKPEAIKEIFRRTVDTGIEHGTVTVMIGKDSYEVTTYRIDGAYEDSRHPKEVRFTNCLEEDLRRRDFTINAMAGRCVWWNAGFESSSDPLRWRSAGKIFRRCTSYPSCGTLLSTARFPD